MEPSLEPCLNPHLNPCGEAWQLVPGHQRLAHPRRRPRRAARRWRCTIRHRQHRGPLPLLQLHEGCRRGLRVCFVGFAEGSGPLPAAGLLPQPAPQHEEGCLPDRPVAEEGGVLGLALAVRATRAVKMAVSRSRPDRMGGKIPLPGRNGLSGRVCDKCVNSRHKDRRDGSAGERRLAPPRPSIAPVDSTLPYCSPGLRRNQRRGRAAHWVTSR